MKQKEPGNNREKKTFSSDFIEGYTKRIEDATTKKIQVDKTGLESAENRLKNVLSEFEHERYRMREGGYIDKSVALCCIIQRN